MKIVIDTNIIFSAILNTNGKIGDLLLNSDEVFQFYSPDFTKDELKEHHDKLEKLSKLSYDDIETLKSLLFKHIRFINTAIIPLDIWLYAEKTMADVDPDDTEFFALAQYLDCLIWTGDKKQHNKLLAKNIRKTILTTDLWELRHSLRE
jgi:predicted nucleic acid-binding protein